jgi:hypothetical protein
MRLEKVDGHDRLVGTHNVEHTLQTDENDMSTFTYKFYRI